MRGSIILFFITLAALCVGCTKIESTPTPAPTIQVLPHTPESEITETPSPTLQPAETQTSFELQYGVRYKVKVVHVVDGDTIDVIMPDGSRERIRILGVDTPEKSVDMNKPYEYDDITDLSYLAGWGAMAAEYAKSILKGKTVEIELDEKAGMRGYYGRLLAYVYFDGQDFGAMLIKNGYARVYTGDFEKEDYYIKLEEEARKNKIGLWNYSPPNVKIVYVHYDAAGEEDDRLHLNDEYVVIQNAGSTAVNLQYWTLEDEANHYYVFPDFTLMPGRNVTVHTGSGVDNSTDLFWGSGKPIWNNDHDTVFLYNSEGELVDSCQW